MFWLTIKWIETAPKSAALNVNLLAEDACTSCNAAAAAAATSREPALYATHRRHARATRRWPPARHGALPGAPMSKLAPPRAHDDTVPNLDSRALGLVAARYALPECDQPGVQLVTFSLTSSAESGLQDSQNKRLCYNDRNEPGGEKLDAVLMDNSLQI